MTKLSKRSRWKLDKMIFFLLYFFQLWDYSTKLLFWHFKSASSNNIETAGREYSIKYSKYLTLAVLSQFVTTSRPGAACNALLD